MGPLQRLQTQASRAFITAGLMLAKQNSRARGGYESGYRIRQQLKDFDLSPDDLARAAEAVVWVDVCIHIRAQAVSRFKRTIKNKYTGEPILNSPFQKAFDQAYLQWQQNIIYNHMASLMIWGEVYLEKMQIGNTHIPGGLRWLNPAVTAPFVMMGEIIRYDYSGGGGMVFYGLDDIAYHKLMRPSDDMRGKSPLMVALGSVNIDRNIERFIKSFYKNDATPGGIIVGRDGTVVDENQAQLIQTQFAEQTKGVDNAFSTILLPWALEYIKMGAEPPTSQKDNEESTAKKICAAFRVPMSMAGAGGVSDPLSAGSTMDAQTANFWEMVAIPDAEEIAMFYNAVVMPWLDPTSELCFESEQVLGLIHNTKEKTDILSVQYNDGVITLNERREKEGYKPLPGGDFLVFKPGTIIVQIEDLERAPEIIQNAAHAGMLATATPTIDVTPIQPVLEAPPVVPQLPAPATADKDVTPPAGKSLYLTLSLKNSPDLIALQGQVKSLLPDAQVEWNAADTFHVTLVHIPAATDEQIKALQSTLATLELPTLSLPIGSLRTFDSLGSHAIHFRLKGSNPDLRDLQETLYDLCVDDGLQMSTYSNPVNYVPHITMGKAKERPRAVPFNPKLSVSPVSLQIGVDDTIIQELPIGEQPDDPTPEPDDEPAPVEDITAKSTLVLDELLKWQRFEIKRAGKSNVRKFGTDIIPPELVKSIQASLDAANDKPAMSAVFEAARNGLELWDIYVELREALLPRPTIKAYTTTRSEFIDTFVALFESGRNNEVNRRQFASRMRSQLRRYGLIAFRDGLESGGMTSESLSTDDVAVFRDWLSEQSSRVTNLGAEMYTSGLTETEVRTRAQLWANLSLDRIYDEGKTRANPGQKSVFRLGGTIQHCADCAFLDGKIATRDDWNKSGWSPRSGVSNRHACGQWNCNCQLDDTDEPVNFNPLEYTTRGRAKAAYDSLSEWPDIPDSQPAPEAVTE